jgi:oxygen-dependent protoporphyrinogen oxidase
MAAEIAVPARRDAADESVGAFFTRRLGREAYQRVVEPLLGGIHAGDAATLSLPATFPRFADQERDHGGLLRAALATRPAKSAPPAAKPDHTPFVSLRSGMSALPDALAAALERAGGRLLTGTAVAAVRPVPGSGYVVDAGDETLGADAVVLATPAHVSATLLEHVVPEAASALGEIPHASTATVSLVLDRAASARLPEGYGFVVPRAERRDLIAATWSSQKWPGRAPDGQMLLRGYVGGIGRENVLDGSDDSLVDLVRRELTALAGITGLPVHVEVHRYPRGMPQYTLGHLGRIGRARAALGSHTGLAVTGAAYSGVGIPDCIADATATAGALASRLALPAR